MCSRIRLFIILLLFLVFWLLPAFVMHFVPSEKALVTANDFLQFALLMNTVIIASAAIIVALLLGLPAAYYIAYANFPFRNFFTLMLLLPLSIPPYIGALGWLHLTNYAIQGETLASLTVAGILFGLSYFPIIALFSAMGFIQIENQIEESARLTHTDRRVFLQISVPLAKPFIIAGAILVFLLVVLDHGVADFFMIQTYSIEIFTQFSLHNLRGAVAATYPLLFLAITLAVIESLLVRNSSYIPSPDSLTGTYRKKSVFAPVLFTLLLIFSAGMPIASIIHMAGGIPHYLEAFHSSIISFGNTFLFGVLSSIVIVLFGFFWAHTIDSFERSKTLLKALSNINLAIPGGLIAISLILMWNRPFTNWIYHTASIIIICNFARFSPIAFKAIMAPFTTTAQHFKDLTKMLSGGYLPKIRYIFFPLARRGLLLGFLIAFLFSIRELSSMLLILPPGKETVPIRIFSLIHYGAHQHVAVLSLGLIMLGFAVSLITLSFARK
jgi:iron(III) transport system permease protein